LDVLLFSFNAISPIIILVVIGYIIKKVGLIDHDFIDMGSNLCFKIALPLHLFRTIYSTDFKKDFSPKFVIFVLGGLFAIVAVSFILVPIFIKDNARRGAVIQAIFRANTLIFGIPLATNLFGIEGVVPTAIGLSLSVPCYNILAVIVLTVFAPNDEISGEKPKLNWGQIAFGIIKNNLVIAAFLGFVLSLLRVKLPSFIMQPFADVASIGTPLALMLLGAQFEFSDLRGNVRSLLGATFIKMVVVPAALVSLGIFAGFRGSELGAILILFGAPVAITSFVMAKAMKSDHVFASQIVLSSTIASGFTFFIIISILKALNLI